jgi:hypothetical protein
MVESDGHKVNAVYMVFLEQMSSPTLQCFFKPQSCAAITGDQWKQTLFMYSLYLLVGAQLLIHKASCFAKYFF